MMVFAFKSCKYPLPVLARSKLMLAVVPLKLLRASVVNTSVEAPTPLIVPSRVAPITFTVPPTELMCPSALLWSVVAALRLSTPPPVAASSPSLVVVVLLRFRMPLVVGPAVASVVAPALLVKLVTPSVRPAELLALIVLLLVTVAPALSCTNAP